MRSIPWRTSKGAHPSTEGHGKKLRIETVIRRFEQYNCANIAIRERTTPAHPLDELDVRMLRELQEHGRLTNVDLAERIGLSAAPCLRRVRTLERAGVVRKYVALVEPKAVGLGVTVFVQIRVDLQLTKGRYETFEQSVLRRPEVLECHLMTGDADYLLRVVVPDVAAYERLLSEWLRRVDGITEIKSNFGLKQVKYSTALPVEFAKPRERDSWSPERTDNRTRSGGRPRGRRD